MKTVKLGDICDFRPVKSLVKNKLSDDAIVSFSPMEYLPVAQKYFTPIQAKKLSDVYSNYVYFENNDVIYAKITPCFENGKMSIARGLKNGVGFGSSEYVPIRCSEALLPEYLYYFLLQPNFINNGKDNMRGASGHKRVTDDYVKNLEIILPSVGQQQKVVERLDAAFEKIDRAIELTKLNLENSQNLFDSISSSTLQNNSKDWVRFAIGDVCELYQGLAINAKTKHLIVESSSLPLLRIKDLRDGTVEQYVDEDAYPVNALVNVSDLIYTRTGQIGLVFRGRKGVIHNNCFKIVPNNNLSHDYLYWWLQDKEFRTKITKLAARAAQPDITHKIFKAQEILLPPIQTQLAIARTIENHHAKYLSLQKMYQSKIEYLLALKQSLLKQSFTHNEVE